LQPKLVGRSVGLHPVWLIFALFAFGSLFGFVGLLIAVPAAAAIGVLVRFALARYLMSPLYTGGKGPQAGAMSAGRRHSGNCRSTSPRRVARRARISSSARRTRRRWR
jgi:hypothetical protein